MLTHFFTLLQMLAIFAILDMFLVFCVILGHLIGFLMFGFKRRRSFLYIYNPLGDLVQFAFES